MSLHEILAALKEGKTVKYLSSRYNIAQDSYGVLYKRDMKNGFKELLDSSDYDDCFV